MLGATGSKPAMDKFPDANFMLGEVRVSPSHNRLWAGDRSVKLQPKAMAVLQYLAHNQARVISNEELIERLWAGRVVTHGSVQKSINALRSALNELVGDREFITHYSKRGYQLTVEPQFMGVEPAQRPSANVGQTSFKFPYVDGHWRKFFLAVAVVFLIVGIYKGIEWDTFYLSRDHQTTFHTTEGYTNETGHERSPTPHPDNQHLAYIRETKADTSLQNTSDIVIRNAKGKDWSVASSHGAWFKLAWSPAGKSLVAIEIKSRDGLPPGNQFYQPLNHLYSFHIFSLDLAHERLVEKQQLSQWQGQIFSVSWWDENTLEIVAKQGPNAGNGRYRYSILDQQLKLLNEYEGAINPIGSATLNHKTAIASSYKNKVRIDFLNARQDLIKQVPLDATEVDISWLPDGSGILVHAVEERKLSVVYLNGKQVAIPLAESKDKVFSRPHYSADGKGIYYTEEKRSSNILLTTLDGTQTRLTENADFNYAASFSPDGNRVIYASVRNNRIHLWLVENGLERQLTAHPIPKKVDKIIWSDNGEQIVFSAANQLYRHNLITNETLLLNDGEKMEPIAYFPGTNRLLVVKHDGEIRNLWRIEGQQQKQLTFGAIGSAIEYGGDVLFQYVSEKGLWALRNKDDSLERITPHLDEYTQLLKADANGIYFMTGGICQESDIFYLDYAAGSKSIFLRQKSGVVSTTSFNNKKGILQTACHLPEANIILMK